MSQGVGGFLRSSHPRRFFLDQEVQARLKTPAQMILFSPLVQRIFQLNELVKLHPHIWIQSKLEGGLRFSVAQALNLKNFSPEYLLQHLAQRGVRMLVFPFMDDAAHGPSVTELKSFLRVWKPGYPQIACFSGYPLTKAFEAEIAQGLVVEMGSKLTLPGQLHPPAYTRFLRLESREEPEIFLEGKPIFGEAFGQTLDNARFLAMLMCHEGPISFNTVVGAFQPATYRAVKASWCFDRMKQIRSGFEQTLRVERLPQVVISSSKRSEYQITSAYTVRTDLEMVEQAYQLIQIGDLQFATAGAVERFLRINGSIFNSTVLAEMRHRYAESAAAVATYLQEFSPADSMWNRYGSSIATAWRGFANGHAPAK